MTHISILKAGLSLLFKRNITLYLSKLWFAFTTRIRSQFKLKALLISVMQNKNCQTMCIILTSNQAAVLRKWFTATLKPTTFNFVFLILKFIFSCNSWHKCYYSEHICNWKWNSEVNSSSPTWITAFSFFSLASCSCGCHFAAVLSPSIMCTANKAKKGRIKLCISYSLELKVVMYVQDKAVYKIICHEWI